MYFPDYLKSNLLLNNYKFNGTNVQADLQCKCGCLSFEVLYLGSTVNVDGKIHACAFDTDTDSFFLIKAKCTECLNEYLLFDADFHGWDGFYCHDFNQAALERPPLISWTCLSCKQKTHNITIKLYHTDQKEYQKIQQNKNRKYIENEWLLSFEWIRIGITCSKCGLENPDWVDYETA